MVVGMRGAFVLTCDISRYLSDLGISFVQRRGDRRLWERQASTCNTAGGRDLATGIRCHNDEERDGDVRFLEQSILYLGVPFEVTLYFHRF